MTRPTGQLELGPILDEVVPSTAELIAPNGGDSVAASAAATNLGRTIPYAPTCRGPTVLKNLAMVTGRPCSR